MKAIANAIIVKAVFIKKTEQLETVAKTTILGRKDF